jgi:hypothetical protein
MRDHLHIDQIPDIDISVGLSADELGDDVLSLPTAIGIAIAVWDYFFD